LKGLFISAEILSTGEFLKEMEQNFFWGFSSGQNVNFSKIPD
jgi:hypothetical protein